MDTYIKPLTKLSQSRQFKKGANLLFQGEVPRRGMLITRGVVRAYSIASSGEERTIAFYTENDLLPLDWLLGQSKNVLFYYEALSDVRVHHVSKQDFTEQVINDHAALTSLILAMSRNYSASLLHINGLEQSRAEEKIAYIIYLLLFRYGKKVTSETYDVSLGLSHAVIATMAGLSRESTTKILRNLQSKDILKYKSGVYTIQKAALERFLGEDAFRDLELQ